MLVHRVLVVRIIFLILVALSGSAIAQCEPTWDATLGNPGITSGYLQPMVAWDDGSGEKLYVGGSATNIGGNALNDFLAQYDPGTGTWSRPGTGIGQGSTNAFLTKIMPWDDGTGEKLYVIGQFATAGGLTSANSFATWDGTSWSGVGAGFTQAVSRVTYDMIPADLGDGERLYLAGNWSSIGGVTASGLAWFDGTDFGAWGTGDGIDVWGGFSPFVAALQMWDDGSGPAIYACGRFRGIDNASTRDVARYNVGTGAWESFGQALFPTGDINNMTSWTLFDDGTGEALYLGGQGFRISGDPNVYLVAKWDGIGWTGIGQTLSGRVTDLQVWDDGSGPALYISGTATFEVNYFAKLVDNTWVPAQSGVNNPPVSGNFSSAFGLYTWGNDLLVAGNFSQVGGFDPVTGVGEGNPIPARGLAAFQPCEPPTTTPDGFDVIIGSVNSGGLPEIIDSDNQYLVVDPQFLTFRYQTLFTVDATSPSQTPSAFEFNYESRVANFVGTVSQNIELFNYDSGQFETVDSRFSTASDSVVSVTPGGDSTRFVEVGTGAMQARIGYENSLPFWVFSTKNLYIPYRVRVDQVFWTITP